MFPMSDCSSQLSVCQRGSFLLWLMAAVSLGLVTAVAIAPVAAIALAVGTLRFPFPRIFDRTLMVTLFASLLLFARRLKLVALLRQGFNNLKSGVGQALAGLAAASAAIALLLTLALVAGVNIQASTIVSAALRYFPAAVVIGVVEEGFFRAFVLGGIEDDLGPFAALIVSSTLYALVHVMRSPARFYLTRFEPAAGAENVAECVERMTHSEIGPSLLGLFLLGLVLGEAFILTRRAYLSVGLHIGFVVSAKTWRQAVSGPVPRWLAGPGSVPLVAAPAAWATSAIMLIVLAFWLERTPDSSRKRIACRGDECDNGDGSTETESDDAERSARSHL
jgi:membrane protease YdiL (CAAX protease family)